MAKRSKRPSKAKRPAVGPMYSVNKASNRSKQAGGHHKRGQAPSRVKTVKLDNMALSETLSRLESKTTIAFRIES